MQKKSTRIQVRIRVRFFVLPMKTEPVTLFVTPSSIMRHLVLYNDSHSLWDVTRPLDELTEQCYLLML